MTSIPYDPTLVLGNIVSIGRIKRLQEQALIQKPVDIANEKMRNLMRYMYKIRMIIQQMKSLKVKKSELRKLKKEEEKCQKAVAKATVEYAKKFLKAQNELFMHSIMTFNQNKIGGNVESPLDFSLCQPEPYKISYDSLTFDVQYFRNEFTGEVSMAQTVSGYVASTVPPTQATEGVGGSLESQVSASMSAAMSHHSVEGTLVIVAHCNHKQALMIDPFIMDPIKAVSAWNVSYPFDMLMTDPSSMIKAALTKVEKKQKKIHLLSGCSLASSFVGFVHILKTETSAEMATSVAASIKATMEQESTKGNFGLSAQAASSFKGLMSNARLENHASLICNGVIPNLKTNTMSTSVKAMQMDPEKTMKALAQMNASSDATNSTMDASAGNSKHGKQFLELSTNTIEGTCATVGKIQDAENKVIDMNSMFTAFSDYVEKAAKGDCGVPTTFYIKSVRKSDVAKCYIKRFYPNGATDPNSTMAQFGV
mmetsp:Transcript_28501/g.43555  ORF Transcript_28501/g.43555 Transcript_28501/m.43555 type:complete len:481 (+) Transcript_28501:94-1536(+)